jgi:hypothetical protein
MSKHFLPAHFQIFVTKEHYRFYAYVWSMDGHASFNPSFQIWSNLPEDRKEILLSIRFCQRWLMNSTAILCVGLCNFQCRSTDATV